MRQESLAAPSHDALGIESLRQPEATHGHHDLLADRRRAASLPRQAPATLRACIHEQLGKSSDATWERSETGTLWLRAFRSGKQRLRDALHVP